MNDEPAPTKGIALGRLFGARVIVQPSTLLMLVALALLFSSGPGIDLDRRTFSQGMLLAVLLFVSVFVHELAHAFTARLFRRDVKEIVITLWGGHTSFDARGLTPIVSGATAAAGPAANLVIAGAGYAVVVIGQMEGRAAWLLSWLVFANILLAVFNALPGIPMDGGRVLEAVVWSITKDPMLALRTAAWGGRVVAVLVVIFALAFPFTRGATPGIFEMVWAGVIFYVLWPAASSALKVARVMSKREAVSVVPLMVTAVAVPFDILLDDAYKKATAHSAIEVVVMSADGVPAGHFPVSLAEAVPRDQWAMTGLQSVTMPLARGAVIAHDARGDALVDALRQSWGATDVWIVMEEQTVVGVIKLADVLEALQ
jgi:Zn-dependent protease